MTITAQKSWLGRAVALGLSLAVAGGLSLVAAAPAMAAPAITVTGTVVAEDGADAGAPLTGAELIVDGEPQSVTDENGEFSVSLEPDTYEFFVVASGYISEVLEVEVTTGDVQLGEISLVAEEPVEEVPATYSISGVVTAKDANPDFAPNMLLSGIAGSSPVMIQLDADGTFTIDRLDPSADLSLQVSADGYGTQVKAVPITDADIVDVNFELLTYLPAGTVTISGAQAVGSTLTATPTGWPAGTTFSHAWGAVGPHQQHSGDIQGANAATLPVTADIVDKRIWVQVIGHKDGFADGYSDLTFAVAPELPTALAPVADSSGLASYLEANGSTPASQTSTGLPAGDLSPTTNYTANVSFAGPDAFVDAYLYSSPVSVGTFPVVNGVAQVTLSAEVLSQLAAGSHTLVIVGQFSGVVSSVSLSVGAVLAATGLDAGVPLGAAVLMLLGGSLVFIRRRRVHA